MTSRALEICDIRNLDSVDCYSIYTDGEFDTDATDIDLNNNASAVVVGSSGFNNNLGTAVLWRRAEIERNAWDRNLGDRFDYVDVGFTGKRVQISADGERVAVVANRNIDVAQNPAVRIYELQNNGSYEEVDKIISEYQMNGFAESIDWSSNGRYLVIGSPDPRFNSAKNQAPDSLTAGAVYVYDCSNGTPNNNSQCDQLGDTLLGDYAEEWFGWKVAIGNQGNRILVSSLKYPQSDAFGENRNGRVRTFNFSNGSWLSNGYEYIGADDYSAAGQNLDLTEGGEFGVFSVPYDSSEAFKSGTIHILAGSQLYE
jgi:hypothetical protein